MPAVNFSVSWPDGENITYYSPSTIIHSYIEKSKNYDLENFKSLCDEALSAASERVYQRFGYYCSAATGEQEKIRKKYNELLNKQVTGNVNVIDIG